MAKGQVFTFNVFTFVKIAIFLAVLSLLLFAILRDQSSVKQSIEMTNAETKAWDAPQAQIYSFEMAQHLLEESLCNGCSLS